MAKSTRSKVKRHFRAKKREDSVYAATEAARLQRLNMKLRAVVAAQREEAEENDEEGMAVEGEKEGAVGWCPSPSLSASVAAAPFLYMALGLVDPVDITPEGLGELSKPGVDDAVNTTREGGRRTRFRGHKAQHRRSGAPDVQSICGLDHLFSSLPVGSGSDNDG